ncbi:twin-arginine translocase TatA/TatE family subunit [Candidatus Pseudothioglobus sp. Uisw_041]|uniref:twin-arginine translocase TatA/TatE family subunit n=1 Tax=Candidatus Pseudothioglobus sp. Uisw_041 TaxID=3230996 RepID=UPI003A88DA3D
MGMPGPFELIIILVIVLLIFGGKRLKNIGNEVGGAIKGFKSSMKDTHGEKKEDIIEAKVEVEADDESSDKKS